MRTYFMKLRGIPYALILLAVAGCARVPPGHINTDRMDYGQVIAESWKRQTLLNVVRLRYADAPVFLDVASVINSYSVAGKASASASLLFAGRDRPERGRPGRDGTVAMNRDDL
jgi:hypothetical protein